MEKGQIEQEEQHIEEILKKLERKIAQIMVSLQVGQQDVNRMQEYYWQIGRAHV